VENLPPGVIASNLPVVPPSGRTKTNNTKEGITMLLIRNDSARIFNFFTQETCDTLKNMDVRERRTKLVNVITSFFQNHVPTEHLAIEIAQEFGTNKELVNNVMNAMVRKGMTGPSDAPHVMNYSAQPLSGIFDASIADESAMWGFEEIYDFVDMRQAKVACFDIVGVTNAITFTEKKTGERMKVYGITTDKTEINKMTIAAAIGILDEWINYTMFWKIIDVVEKARSKYYERMAADHYAVLKAISSDQNEAFATDDITTINNACNKIFDDCAGKGYVLTGNERFILRANPTLKSRIERALALTFNAPINPDQIVHNIDCMYSTKLEKTSYYVGLPGKKAKRGVWSDLSAEISRDVLLSGSDVAYTGGYNAAIGEEDQFRRCFLS
jgi:hypothetical protein